MNEKIKKLKLFFECCESQGARIYNCSNSILNQSKLVLVFSNEMDLSGAPIALLNALIALKKLGYYPILISPTDGKLRTKITNLNIPVIVYKDLYFGTKIEEFYEIFDFLFINTLCFSPNVIRLNGTKNKILWWIHEAGICYQLFRGQIDLLPQKLGDNISIYAVGDYAKEQMLKFRPNYNVGNFLYYIPDKEIEPKLVDFGFEDDDKVIFAMVGALEKRKGYNVLLKAFSLVSPSLKERTKVVCVGSKKDDYIYEMVNKAKANINLTYLEKIDMELMPLFYKKINCLICASIDDPMPLVVAEAWKYSVPVICSESTGSAKIIKEYDAGIVYKKNEPRNLAYAIEQFIQDRSNKKIVENGMNTYIELFTFNSFKENLKNILMNLE